MLIGTGSTTLNNNYLTMYKITFLRVIAQVASFILVLSLRNISEEVLGTYALALSIFSVLSVLIMHEGTFLVISKNVYPSNFFVNLKFNRLIWLFIVIAILYYSDLGITITMCLLGFLLTLDSEYFINILTLGKRAHGDDERFRKYLKIKIILTEFSFPLISAFAIYFDVTSLVLIFYSLIFTVMNILMIYIAQKRIKKNSFYKALPSLKGTITSFLKRTDSQLPRLFIGTFFGSAFLGSIYPALLIGRAGSILGNIWYTYYFNRLQQVISASKRILSNLSLVFIIISFTSILYAFISERVFTLIFNWEVNTIFYALFFLINIGFFHKTFIRSISVNRRKINLFNLSLATSILSKLIIGFSFEIDLEIWLTFSALIDLLIFLYLQKILNKTKSSEKVDPKNISLLRVTNLPTPDFPSSGLTSFMISKDTKDKLAIPFPKDLCLFDDKNPKIISDLKFDLRSRKRPKWIRLLITIYYCYILSRIAKSEKINTVHIHWVPLIFTTIFLGNQSQYVLTIHGEDARYLVYFPFRYIAKKFSKIYVVGSYWTNFLKEKGFNVQEIQNFSPIEESIKENIFIDIDNQADIQGDHICLVGAEKDHKNIKIFKDMPPEFFSYLEEKKLTLSLVGISEEYFKKIFESDLIPSGINICGRRSRLETLREISKSKFLVIPSFTEGNPKVVWEAVELNTIPIISETLTFLDYNHKDYPFRFDPYDARDFWEKLKLAIKSSENLVLDDYFNISSYLSVREEYNKTYFKE